jgi:hypothetical protein
MLETEIMKGQICVPDYALSTATQAMLPERPASDHYLNERRLISTPDRSLSGERQPVLEAVAVPDPDVIGVILVTARRIVTFELSCVVLGNSLLGRDELPVQPRVVNNMAVGKGECGNDTVKNGEIINPTR